MVATTAAAPAISPFMVIIPPAVLIERPPLSKVIPFPARATVRRAPGGR